MEKGIKEELEKAENELEKIKKQITRLFKKGEEKDNYIDELKEKFKSS